MRVSLGCPCRGRVLLQEGPILGLERLGGDDRRRSFREFRRLFDQARRPEV
jgi:hypothetical protein